MQLLGHDKRTRGVFIEILAILVPLLIWIVLFRNFINQNIAVNIDTFSNYAYVKYYLNNIHNGTFPLWNPYMHMGRAFTAVVSSGFFNPLFYLITLLFKLGFNYYEAYIYYLVTYFFIGVLGGYFLSQKIMGDKKYAYASYLLLLFSGFGVAIFNQVYLLLLFVPAIWFFYFFIDFLLNFKKSALVASTFCFMLIMTSYMPFYFFTSFSAFILILAILYFRNLSEWFVKLKNFSRSNFVLITVCLLAVFVSAVPLGLYKMTSSTGDFISPARQSESCLSNGDKQKCYEGGVAMEFEDTGSHGTLGERVVFTHLFSHLDKSNYATDDFFYLSIFSYIIIFLSLITTMDKKKLLLLFWGLLIYLISLGSATPIHRFLHNVVFYFKYYRNYLYYMAYLMPLVAIFSVVQLKSLVEYKATANKDKKNLLLYIVIAHLAFVVFLFNQGHIIFSSYLTVLISLIFFFLLYTGRVQFKSKAFLWIISLLVTIQPTQVFSLYNQNASDFKCYLPTQHAQPKFVLTRLPDDQWGECSLFEYRAYGELRYLMGFKDSPGIVKGFPSRIARWVYYFSEEMDEEVFTNYVKNKFYLYDSVRGFNEEDAYKDVGVIEDLFKNKSNVALVSNMSEGDLASLRGKKALDKQKIQALDKESERFKVLDFDVNAVTLKTNYAMDKFLVYTDSFHTYWKVFINGNEDKVYRANLAFKGVLVPKGENIIKFQYAPPGGGVYIFVAIFFILFFLYTIFIVFLEKSK